MIPKVEFRYSWIYDNRYRDSPLMKKFLKKNKQKYPSNKAIINYVKEIEKIWKKQGKGVLEELSKIIGLKWKENKIICYVIGMGRSFSDPLTIKVYNNTNYFIDTLVHELIHQLQSQNNNLWKKWWVYINKKYRKETGLTRRHVLLHAVHWKLMLKLFDEKRLKKEIKASVPYKDYKRSWGIVQKEGYQNIINEFKKRLK